MILTVLNLFPRNCADFQNPDAQNKLKRTKKEEAKLFTDDIRRRIEVGAALTCYLLLLELSCDLKIEIRRTI